VMSNVYYLANSQKTTQFLKVLRFMSISQSLHDKILVALKKLLMKTL